MKIARGGWPWILGTPVIPVVLGLCLLAAGQPVWGGALLVLAAIAAAFMVFFFRDPERTPPRDEGTFVSGADGIVRNVREVTEERYLQGETVRVSVFLSPFDVHVNRSPMAGEIKALAYARGKHLLTIRNESSEKNQHSSILIHGKRSRCLVKQIVGPVVRRVVYWLEQDQQIVKGERIGIMRFGSRMDIYFPRDEVDILVKSGDRVRAGETLVARLKKDDSQ